MATPWTDREPLSATIRYRVECVQCGPVRRDTDSEQQAVVSAHRHTRSHGPTHEVTTTDLWQEVAR